MPLVRSTSNPLRGPRKVLRRVPSAVRSPASPTETSQKRPHTAHERAHFSRLTDSPVSPGSTSWPSAILEATRSCHRRSRDFLMGGGFGHD